MRFREATSILLNGYIMLAKLPEKWHPTDFGAYLYYLDKDKALIQCSIHEISEGRYGTRAFVVGQVDDNVHGILLFPEARASCLDFDDENKEWCIAPQSLIYQNPKCSIDMNWVLPRLPETGQYPAPHFEGKRENTWISFNLVDQYLQATPGGPELISLHNEELARIREIQAQKELDSDMKTMQEHGYITRLTFFEALDILKETPGANMTTPGSFFDTDTHYWYYVNAGRLIELFSYRGHKHHTILCSLSNTQALHNLGRVNYTDKIYCVSKTGALYE